MRHAGLRLKLREPYSTDSWATLEGEGPLPWPRLLPRRLCGCKTFGGGFLHRDEHASGVTGVKLVTHRLCSRMLMHLTGFCRVT